MMDISQKDEIVRAIDEIAKNAATSQGPEGSPEFARSYSLYIRDARKHISNKAVRLTLKNIAIWRGDDAGLSEDETLKYWENTDG